MALESQLIRYTCPLKMGTRGEDKKDFVESEAYLTKWQYGDVWEWTTSPYVPYPGFKAVQYNGFRLANDAETLADQISKRC